MKLSEIFRKIVTPADETPAREITKARKALKTSVIKKIGEIETLEGGAPFEPSRPPLPAGYVYPDATEAARLHAQLLSALTDAHSLYSVPLETFATREDNSATLFRFRGNPQRYALVNLSETTATGVDNSGVLFVGAFEEFLKDVVAD